MYERKIHLPQPLIRNPFEYSIVWTACGRWQDWVDMADEPDEGHATCLRCVDYYHFEKGI